MKKEVLVYNSTNLSNLIKKIKSTYPDNYERKFCDVIKILELQTQNNT